MSQHNRKKRLWWPLKRDQQHEQPCNRGHRRMARPGPECRLLSAVLILAFAVQAHGVEDYNNPVIEPLALAEAIWPERLTSQYTPIPDNETWVRVRHMGDVGTPQLEQQVANPVNSDRSDKTGLAIPVLPGLTLGRFQRGFEDDPGRGTNVYQVFGTSFGWQLNSFQFSSLLPIECPEAFPACSGGPNIAYSRRFSPPLNPWPTPSSELTLQTHMKLPHVHYRPGPVPAAAQISFLYYLEHQPTGFLLAGIINLFDTRPFETVGFERVASDGITAFVSSDLRARQPDGTANRYVTRSPFSARSSNRFRWEGERFFRAHVSLDNLNNILADTGAPGTPEEYRLIEASVFIEAFPRKTGDVSFAGSFRNFALYRFYDE